MPEFVRLGRASGNEVCIDRVWWSVHNVDSSTCRFPTRRTCRSKMLVRIRDSLVVSLPEVCFAVTRGLHIAALPELANELIALCVAA